MHYPSPAQHHQCLPITNWVKYTLLNLSFRVFSGTAPADLSVQSRICVYPVVQPNGVFWWFPENTPVLFFVFFFYLRTFAWAASYNRTLNLLSAPIGSLKVLFVLLDLLRHHLLHGTFPYCTTCLPLLYLCFHCHIVSLDYKLLKGAPLFSSVEGWWTTAHLLPSWLCPWALPELSRSPHWLGSVVGKKVWNLLDPCACKGAWSPQSFSLLCLVASQQACFPMDSWSCFWEVELYLMGVVYQQNPERGKYDFDLMWLLISSCCGLSSRPFPPFTPYVLGHRHGHLESLGSL